VNARESAVGNSQSDVNDMMQNRVLVPRKALASTPPWSSDKGHDAFLLDEPAMTSAAKGFIAAAARERGL
jgi:homoserine acetyltransferase